jgi:cytochrome P450
MGATTSQVEQLDVSYMQDPHIVHERLRQEGPATEVILPRGLKVWFVTRYDEARTALADPRFSKDMVVGGGLFEKHLLPGVPRREFDESLSAHMLSSDPPNHTRLRKLVNKAFTARRVEGLRPRIAQITAELLDAMQGQDEVDLLDALAFPLPITVICELLDVPLDERDDFRVWSNTLLSNADPEPVRQAAMAMAQYLARLVEHKRERPGDDIFSALVHASESESPLDPASGTSVDRLDQNELVSMAFLLLVAGHETTVNLIGNGVLALLRNPDQLAALRADPSLISGAVEEFLRFEGPVNLATFRFTTEPVTLGEVTIPADELVLVSLISANRDPERFPDPERLDITRPAGGHLAFGHGIHYCLGAPLARLEGEIAINALLARFPDLRLAEEPQQLRWRESTLLRGLHDLPVRLHS